MPQKNNFDVGELLRANSSRILGFEMTLKSLTNNLISGYHRDLQLSKEPLLKSFDITLESLEMANLVVEHLEPNVENLEKRFTPEIFATDVAHELVKNGVPFRDAYKKIGNNLDQLKNVDVDKNIREKTHLGATGNLGLDILKKRLDNTGI